MKDTFVRIMVWAKLHIKHSVAMFALTFRWEIFASCSSSQCLLTSQSIQVKLSFQVTSSRAGVALTSRLSPAEPPRPGQIQTNWSVDSRYTIQNGQCERKHLPNPSPAPTPLTLRGAKLISSTHKKLARLKMQSTLGCYKNLHQS